MKSTKFIVPILSAVALAGCISTDLVAVDKNTAKATGIEITSFEENPFFAHVKYDFSKIKDFDESKVSVYLAHTSTTIPSDGFGGNSNLMVWADGNNSWAIMAMSSYANALPAFHWKKKDVTILHREPGYIKILAIDDIGTYVVTYNN